MRLLNTATPQPMVLNDGDGARRIPRLDLTRADDEQLPRFGSGA